MIRLLPLISGAFSAGVSMTANTASTIDFELSGNTEPDWTASLTLERPDHHHMEDNAPIEITFTGSTFGFTGLGEARSYRLEACSTTVNSTDGCVSGLFRTAGTAVYVTSINHYFNGTAGGKEIYGAYYYDDSATCVSAAEISFNGCDVTVTVYGADSDPMVRQFPGSTAASVIVGVGAGHLLNAHQGFVTFKAELATNTLDACWGGNLDIGVNPLLDNMDYNATTAGDYFGQTINNQLIITVAALGENDVSTETSSVVAMTAAAYTGIFDGYGNNVTDVHGDTGIPMQNQTNFILQGLLGNATTDLNEANVVCPWSATIEFGLNCATINTVAGNLDWTADAGPPLTYSATSNTFNTVFFMQGEVDAPKVLAGCDSATLEGATATVTLRSFN